MGAPRPDQGPSSPLFHYLWQRRLLGHYRSLWQVIKTYSCGLQAHNLQLKTLEYLSPLKERATLLWRVLSKGVGYTKQICEATFQRAVSRETCIYGSLRGCRNIKSKMLQSTLYTGVSEKVPGVRILPHPSQI